MSTGVRPGSTRTSIVAEGDEGRLAAMDHDFHYGSLVPSVLLRCNIPSDISGSFFVGTKKQELVKYFLLCVMLYSIHPESLTTWHR